MIAKIISFYNNKGGVGKTTSVINIAYTIAEKCNKKVLVIDCDGQRNASRFFTEENVEKGIEETLLKGEIPITSRFNTRYKNIDILVSTEKLNSICSDFEKLEKEKQIENAKLLFLNNEYDFILLDLPPAMNIVTETFLKVSDSVIVPIELGTFAIQGIANVTSVINEIGANFGGCFVTKFDKKNQIDFALLEILNSSLSNKAFKSIIPYSKVIKNSISYKLTALEYMGWTSATKKYTALTKEILERVSK